jgi:hypothetical protein
MIDSLDSLRRLMTGSLLQGREVLRLEVPRSAQTVLAIQIEADEVESAWQLAQNWLPQTGRCPVVSLCGAYQPKPISWAERVEQENFFARFEYSPDLQDPLAIIAVADQVDLETFLAERLQDEFWFENLEDSIDQELRATARECGSAPSREQLMAALGQDPAGLTRWRVDRWLLDWEQAQGCQIKGLQAHLQWFEPNDAVALMLMPTTCSWDVLAYMSWYPAYHQAEKYIALGRRWQAEFGSEIVTHYGTMLQCYVTRPPQTLEAAWKLAQEQVLVAEYTIWASGTTLRHHALALLGYDRWFLHDRP